MPKYIYNIPHNYNYMYRNYYPNNFRNYNNRLIGGGFLAPFALGFLSAPLILPGFNPYYRPRPYPMYYNNYYYPYPR